MYSGVFKDGAPHKCLGALAAHAQCKLLREWRARYSSKVHTGKGQRDLLPNRGHVLGHKGGGQNDGGLCRAVKMSFVQGVGFYLER